MPRRRWSLRRIHRFIHRGGGGNESGLYLSREYRRRRLSFLQPPRLIVTPGGGPDVPANKRPADDLAHIPRLVRVSIAFCHAVHHRPTVIVL